MKDKTLFVNQSLLISEWQNQVKEETQAWIFLHNYIRLDYVTMHTPILVWKLAITVAGTAITVISACFQVPSDCIAAS